MFDQSRACLGFLAAAILLLLMAGCSGSLANQAAPSPSDGQTIRDANLNPTAIALHELAGRLLVYLAEHDGAAPPTLAALSSSFPREQTNGLVDPASNLPWVYFDQGPEIPPYLGRMTARQAQVSEPGYCWVLTLEKGRTARHFVTHVYRVPMTAIPPGL